MSCFTDIENKPDDWLVLDPLTVQKPIPKTGCDTNLIVLNYLSEFKTDALKLKVKDNLGLYVDNILSKNSTNPIANKTVYEAFSKFTDSNNITKVTWDANSNMNDFKTSGVYDIYGERTRQNDNLPILNASSGHSIAARLTVVASTLQPANNEICVTQFLQLSNRIGGEGATYVRTYNENNNNMNGWSAWQKQVGMVETYMNGDNYGFGFGKESDGIDSGVGLYYFIDNGIYSGVYVDDKYILGQSNTPSFIETFVLIVINDYAITGKLDAQQHITQLKYAVDAITGQSTVKKRVGTVNDTISWSNWEDVNGSNTIFWGESSNLNDYKTAGTYEIYGERRNLADNLPILNSNPGHSIAAKLTVIDSSLRKTDGTLPTEICVTQFLMLSNRKGGDGNMYVRTYNENNSPAADWWTPWQKLQGIREGYIFTDTVQVNPDGGVQQIDGVTGLNNMVDNGIYSGIYTDDPTFQAPTFIDTFTLIVINNYAVASKDSRLKRTISQLKYAVDAITNQVTVKKRTKTDGDTVWSDWEILNKDEISSMISTEIKKVTDSIDPEKINSIKDIVTWIDANGGDVTAIYNAIQQNTDNIDTITENIENIVNYIAEEVETLVKVDDTIKSSALGYDRQTPLYTADKVTIKNTTLDGKKEHSFDISAATAEKAGVMSAKDKENLNNSVSTEIEIEPINEGVAINYWSNNGESYDVVISNATEKYAGVMSAADKVKLEETRNFLDRLMTGLGTSDVTVVADRILAMVNPASVNVEPETPIEE